MYYYCLFVVKTILFLKSLRKCVYEDKILNGKSNVKTIFFTLISNSYLKLFIRLNIYVKIECLLNSFLKI